MANVNLNEAPYYDRFAPNSNRERVLFHADRALQQSELNEMQSIFDFNVKRMGDSIFKDGAIQSGMAFNFTYVDPKDKTKGVTAITVEDGFIYLAGKIRSFTAQTIPFTGKGKEIIGVELSQKVITSADDPTLLDPTQDVANYLSEGADRLEERVVITYNKDAATSIYEFNDGDLFIEPDRPEFSLINDVIAFRDKETFGSYQIEGFQMWVDKGLDANHITVGVDSGVAYVNGYRISKPSSTRIQVPKEKTTSTVNQEGYTYDSAKQRVVLSSQFVNKVSVVVGRTDSPSEASGGVRINKGVKGGRDTIPAQYTNIDDNSLKVYVGSTVYIKNTDYRLVMDGGIQYIQWGINLNGKEPDTGTAYNLTFEYDRVMVENTDYKVARTDNENGIGWITEILFNVAGGTRPKANGRISVTYDYTLSREDIVTLDMKGNFTLIQGQPAREGDARIPDNVDPLTFKIGNIHLFPNSDEAIVKNTAVMRLRMEDLQVMKARLENVEYNQAILMLEKQATKSQDPLTMRGVFADAFTDFSRIDKAETTVAFSFDDAHITLSTNTPDNQKVRPKFMENESVAKSWGRLVTAPFTETAEIVQPLATSPMNVNPYQVFNKQGLLKLEPSADNWIDEQRITLYNEEFATTNINRWWAHQGDGDAGKLNDYNQWLVDNTNLLGGAQWNEASLGWLKTDKAEGVMWSSAQTTRNEMVEYMRPIDVSFSVSNLSPFANNLTLTFDGVRVDVKPTGSTVAGSQTGTVRADANGVATGTFKIPPNIRTGTREVTIRGGTATNVTDQATTTFSAQGTAKITTDTITRTHVTFNLYDPLAQSFAFPQARVVSSVGVYFASKPSSTATSENIIMQIRGLSDGGLPNRTVYAERVLTPKDINVSSDATLETKIALDDPLMVEAGQSYCVVFITDSANYTMWTATLGEDTVGVEKQTVTSQPYVNGVLFSSSNAVSWTVHQTTDMKFKIYTATFAEEGIIEFDTMRNIDSNGILLMASYLTPDNTGCSWEVKIVPQSSMGTVSIDNVPWLPLSNYSSQQTPFVVGLAKLRAKFKSNRYISPMLALDDLLFVNFVSATEGKYTTRTIDQKDAPFNTIIIEYSEAAPAGTSVTPQYSLNGGTNWVDFNLKNKKTAPDTAEFTRISITETVGNNQTSVKYRLLLKGDNRFLRPRVKKLTALNRTSI
ncbi:tail fiber protein [Bacillus phage Vinny]|uniref:Tail fiber protein n=1 Tax=Bacillus phage Vinny TaxID=1805955 RepID=A0A143FIT2_9CAUD|nr:tail fiber protein [Bacillus phage Vinny]